MPFCPISKTGLVFTEIFLRLWIFLVFSSFNEDVCFIFRLNVRDSNVLFLVSFLIVIFINKYLVCINKQNLTIKPNVSVPA